MTTDTSTAETQAPGHGLSVAAIDEKPRNFHFNSGNNADYGDADSDEVETWSMVYPSVDDWTPRQCWTWLREQNYADPSGEVPNLYDVARGDTDAILEAWRDAVRDGMQDGDADAFAPVMNYAYPLPNWHRMTAEQAQAALETIQTACVVVNIDGDPWLALAGGGMDLTWDICRAYIALGYYPPVHFAARLPRQGDTDLDTARICAEACRIAARWATNHVEDAERMVEYTADLLAQRT